METMLSKALREFTTGPLNQLIVNLGGEEGDKWEQQLKQFLRKEPCWVDDKIDPIVRVDRTMKLVFPDWVKEIIHPEIQDAGPSEFDITKVERSFHYNQKGLGTVNGKIIYQLHKDEDMLANDFGLRELLAIQAKGVKFFRAHFRGKFPVGWKSVVLQQTYGRLHVPCLDAPNDVVSLHWIRVDNDYSLDFPALRHASSPQN